MPENASPAKVAASKSYGAEVILHGDARAAFVKVLEVSKDRGLTFLHPFDDEEVIVGHGSCARGIALVTDNEIVLAMKALLERMKLLVEPSGAAGLASLLANKIPLERDGPVVVILTGGNADLIELSKLLS